MSALENNVLALAEVTVQLGGRPLSEVELASLSEIRILQKLSLPDLCELTFTDQFEPGASISYLVAGLSLEVQRQGQSLFTGEVTALEYGYEPDRGQTLRVRSYSLLHRLRKRQPVRTFVQVGLKDLAQELTKDLGFTVEGSGPETVWRRVLQHGQSDLDLLTDRANASGVYFTLSGTSLQLLTLEGKGEPVPLALGESLLEAHVELNGDPCCRFVSAQGWNPFLVQPNHGKAEQARLTRTIPANIPPDRFEEKGEQFLVSRSLENDRAADALAQARLDAQVAREVTFWGVAVGNVKLRPGAVIEVDELATPLNGRYVVTEATHSFTPERGFVTEISTCPPPTLPESKSAAAILGKISNVTDPENLGRVQATLPACDDLETDWMQVVSAGAGSGKGLMMLPDVGDLVLILCLEGDFAQGIVLGGLYGSDGCGDSVDDGHRRKFAMRTAGGHAIQFDDTNKVFRLEDGSGSVFELKPGKLRIESKGDMEIGAPGKTIVIRGKAINFEEG
jgi:phage baseplate assembly protein gpV/phage protein D